MQKKTVIITLTLLFMSMFACSKKQTWTDEEAKQISERMQKYVLTPMPYDASGLTGKEKQLLKTLIEVGKLADEIFWHQTNAENARLRREIQKSRSADDLVRRFFEQQAGPYDRLDHNAPFMDVPPKPATAGFYPPDLTKAEFEQWIAAHPEDKDAFLSPYTVIRREGEKLVAVPYHEAYRTWIVPMVNKLREAAKLTEHEGFRDYLLKKAEALMTDNYFEADVAWIDLEGSKFDMVLGPFEVYEDELNNLKASYEASVEIVDQQASAQLDKFTAHLAELEDNLPYPQKYKNKDARLTAAFAIVQDIYRGGDIRVGYQPVAANLPNDPEVHAKKGTKKTFWKNVLDARLQKIIAPISKRLITEDQVAFVTAQGFFDFVLMHEIAHGLGPRYVHGTNTPVNVALRDLYSWIEENKASLAGLHSLRYLREHNVVDPELQRQHYVSYLGSIFRSIRFGTSEAHGKAAIVTLNFLMENGGIDYDTETQKYSVNFSKIDDGITLLTNKLLLIEAEGDYDAAKELEAAYAGTPDFVQASLHDLQDLPIDLVPVYEVKWE